jgi:hypothetical protein
MQTLKLVDVFVNHKSELCATLTDGTVAVRCDDVLDLDFVDYAAMRAEFEDWCAAAEAGEDGYYFVAV